MADRVISRIVYPEGLALVRTVQAASLQAIVLSATTTFIVRLIAERLFHADAAIGVDLVERDGRITGEIEGVPSFQEGKIVRLTEFLRPMGLAPSDALFLTDSRNDLPLARAAGACVNPDPVLEAEAGSRGWPVLAWRLPA